MSDTTTKPWIHSPTVDGFFILGPAMLATGLGALGHRYLPQTQDIPVWAWVLLVMSIDVGHVYSTLYRTYFDKEELKRNRDLYILTPLLCWLGGVVLYSFGWMYFWRSLAYLAVFHFIRQQYGFMRLYSRKEKDASSAAKWADRAVIYMATIYPLIYWHTHIPRNFHWFIEGDFVAISWPALDQIGFGLYIAAIAGYLAKEIYSYRMTSQFNLPRNLLVLGTLVSWYVGIVVFNGDLAFTATNVVAHGIPYMALIWIYSRKKSEQDIKAGTGTLLAGIRYVSMRFIPLFVAVLVFFGFVEEGLWDALVWREHASVFKVFWSLPQLADPSVLAWVVPFLALPQSTHYVLDGFIWRLKSPKIEWKKFVFKES